jgi:putative ABC transport system permease protein
MRVALRELLRRPGRFVVIGAAQTLLVLLLLFLGGLLDGLFLGSTGAIRASDPSAVVFTADARESLLRSKIEPALRAKVEQAEGVEAVGGVGVTLLGVQVPGESEIADGAILGYELATSALPEPPGPGQTYADESIEARGASIGDTLLVGPAEVPLEIVGWVEDTNYLQQSGLWVEPGTWRAVQAANRPDAPFADGEFQVLMVRGADGVDDDALGTAIDAATGGVTASLTETEAVQAIPGIKEQNATFTAIIGATIFVVGLVVALFFALIVLERAGIYAVLKAVGAPSRTLVAGVIAQAVVVALGAFALGAFLTYLLSLVIPPEVPVQFEPGRGLFLLVAVLIAAVVGALVTFRRIIRIEPAAAIGAGV